MTGTPVLQCEAVTKAGLRCSRQSIGDVAGRSCCSQHYGPAYHQPGSVEFIKPGVRYG